MRFALVIVGTIALALSATAVFFRGASAADGDGTGFCCVCDCVFDDHLSTGATSGGAAGNGAQGTCFTGFTEQAPCSNQCEAIGCTVTVGLVKEACSVSFCSSINGQAITTPAPLFQPLGMVLAAFAAALAGGWSLLQRRRAS